MWVPWQKRILCVPYSIKWTTNFIRSISSFLGKASTSCVAVYRVSGCYAKLDIVAMIYDVRRKEVFGIAAWLRNEVGIKTSVLTVYSEWYGSSQSTPRQTNAIVAKASLKVKAKQGKTKTSCYF